MSTGTTFRPLLPFAAAVGLILSAAAVHGLRTDRWGKAQALEVAGGPLTRVPDRLGDWVGTEVELDARQLQMADLAGHLCREYVHGPTRRKVLVLLVYGRPGAVGAHTPDVCYQGAGYQFAAAAAREAFKRGGEAADFWTGSAVKEGPRPEALSIRWCWSTDLLRWGAPSSPRWHYALAPVLYKLYLVRPVPPGGEEAREFGEDADGLCELLLRALKDAVPSPGAGG